MIALTVVATVGCDRPGCRSRFEHRMGTLGTPTAAAYRSLRARALELGWEVRPVAQDEVHICPTCVAERNLARDWDPDGGRPDERR